MPDFDFDKLKDQQGVTAGRDGRARWPREAGSVELAE
jgi:hypothetical protein